MNYYAHALPFLDDPYFVAGVAIPDWLSMADRRVRVRSKHAAPFCQGNSPVARLARGVQQHHHDDGWFHDSLAFAELSMRFSLDLRERLPAGDSWRTGFLGHILVELLLDAELIADAPPQLERYYAALGDVDPEFVAGAIERMCGKRVEKLPGLIPRFIAERFLFDYLDDEKLGTRVNQVLRRVGLTPLPPEFVDALPAMRRQVRARRAELLAAPHDAQPRSNFSCHNTSVSIVQ